MKSIIIIPSRMDSERLLGKPLLMAGGKALVHHVYDQAKQTTADHVIVATPDQEVGRYCEAEGLVWRPTREDNPTGTHRCAEVIQYFKELLQVDVVLNWQVDEPFVEIADINQLMISCRNMLLVHDLRVIMTMTCGTPPDADGPWWSESDPNNVKAAVDTHGRCHWFSRLPLPGAELHCGIYAFPFDVLVAAGKQRPEKLAEAERLEQLNWIIGMNVQIRSLRIKQPPLAINTPDDWERFKEIIEQKTPTPHVSSGRGSGRGT